MKISKYVCDICNQEKEPDKLTAFTLSNNNRLFHSNVVSNGEVHICNSCMIVIKQVSFENRSSLKEEKNKNENEINEFTM